MIKALTLFFREQKTKKKKKDEKQGSKNEK